MQIVIPMSGFGERFRAAGYTVPKPLIPVEGKPIIAHVIDMFPGENEFYFVCNEDHLGNPEFLMEETLLRYCPDGKIIAIPPHKLGPVHAALRVRDLIDNAEPTVINYCDFTCYWDFEAFSSFVEESGCDGAIPAYRGFHPHSLGSTYYAYLKTEGSRVLDIQEKQPFTDTPMQEFASSGTYYFKSGEMAIQYLERTIEEDWRTGDEFYVSLTYKPMFADDRDIRVYELQHFMQWGTPEDLEEYQRWSAAFQSLVHSHSTPAPKTDVTSGIDISPLAGLRVCFARFTQRRSGDHLHGGS
jgi:NDP-sugar pyrophosphorylase family protein